MSSKFFLFITVMLFTFYFHNTTYPNKKDTTSSYPLQNSFTGTWDSKQKDFNFELDIVQTNDSLKGKYSYASLRRLEARDGDESDTDKIYTIEGKIFKDSALVIFYCDSREPDTEYSADTAYLIKVANITNLKWHRLSYNTFSYAPDVITLFKEK